MIKHVVLVGNGPVQGGLPVEADDAFLVRFNSPREETGQTGTQCNALCVTNHGEPARRFAKRKLLLNSPYLTPSTEIWFPRPRRRTSVTCHFSHPSRRVRWVLDHSRHIVRRNQLGQLTLVFFSEQIWSRAFALLSLDTGQQKVSPSSGFLALVYVLERFPQDLYDIHLIGFTFQGSYAHPWDLERRAVERIVEADRILWHQGSTRSPCVSL